MNEHRYTIERAAWLRPLLVLFTATDSRAWVELAPEGLRARYGWYTTTIPYDAIVVAGHDDWPWYGGLGWRTNFRSVLALNGSYRGIVKLAVDPPQRTRLLGIRFGLRELYLSLEDPDRFLRDLEARVTTGSRLAAGA